MLGVRLEPDLEKQLEKYAKKTKQQKSSCVKQALREFLQSKMKEEWHDQRTLLAAEQIEEGKTIPLKDIFSYLKSWKSDE